MYYYTANINKYAILFYKNLKNILSRDNSILSNIVKSMRTNDFKIKCMYKYNINIHCFMHIFISRCMRGFIKIYDLKHEFELIYLRFRGLISKNMAKILFT